MRLRDQIIAASCAGWVSLLGTGIYFACEADNPGAQDAQSRTRTELPRTGESAGANPRSPGFAQYRLMPCSAVLPESRVVGSWECAPSDGSAQSVSSRPLPVSSEPVLLEEAGRGHFQRMATSAAELCGVPPALFHALIERESSWRPHVVSRAGAVGLAQVKPSTGREISRTLDVHDPWQNLVAGACYLRKQFARFGTWRKALHAYRLGPNARVSIVAREYASDIIEGSAQ